MLSLLFLLASGTALSIVFPAGICCDVSESRETGGLAQWLMTWG